MIDQIREEKQVKGEGDRDRRPANQRGLKREMRV